MAYFEPKIKNSMEAGAQHPVKTPPPVGGGHPHVASNPAPAAFALYTSFTKS